MSDAGFLSRTTHLGGGCGGIPTFFTNGCRGRYIEHFQTLTLDMYSGDSDLVDHLCYFNTKMVVGSATDAVKYRFFPSTFKGRTMTWFIKQPPYLVRNFTDLSTKFLTQFSANHVQKATTVNLFNARQRDGEMIQTYMAQFCKYMFRFKTPIP